MFKEYTYTNNQSQQANSECSWGRKIEYDFSKVGRRYKNPSTNNELSELFENNLKLQMTDFDWD